MFYIQWPNTSFTRQSVTHLIIPLVADPGLPGLGRGPTPKEGAPTYYLGIFPKNVNKLKKWTSRGQVEALSYNHTERQASRQAPAASEVSDLCNGSGTHLECKVKRHHRLALVMLLLPLPLTLDMPLDARCGYTLSPLSLDSPKCASS